MAALPQRGGGNGSLHTRRNKTFGEEAVEAEHPAWARAAQLRRAIKNPRARLLVTKRHSEAKKRAAKIPHTKKSRVSKKQRLAAAAGGGGT